MTCSIWYIISDDYSIVVRSDLLHLAAAGGSALMSVQLGIFLGLASGPANAQKTQNVPGDGVRADGA